MDQSLTSKLQDYKADDRAKELVRQTPILLLVGPSGAGKDALKNKLLSTGKFHHIISHTTRQPRINQGVAEKNGVNYHFIDKTEAEHMLDNHEFIEAKAYSDHLYGTSVAEIQAAHDEGRIAVTDIEVQGVGEYKKLDRNVMAVFILPPDFETWQQRLMLRYGNHVDHQDYERRLRTALNELDQLLHTDNYIAVINQDLDQLFQHVLQIVQSDDHKSELEPQARVVAENLRQDINKYMTTNV